MGFEILSPQRICYHIYGCYWINHVTWFVIDFRMLNDQKIHVDDEKNLLMIRDCTQFTD